MKKLSMALAAAVTTACAASSSSQRPDIGFWCRFESKVSHEAEVKIEDFLRKKGFQVLNLETLRRQADRGFFQTDIVAIDSKRRTVRVIAFPEHPESASINLYSPPPTQHDETLEAALLAFATNTLSCRATELQSNTNDDSARSAHDVFVQRIQGWFEQAAKGGNGTAQQVIPADPLKRAAELQR